MNEYWRNGALAELRVPSEWPEISRSVERFVERFFRRRPEIDQGDLIQETLFQLLRMGQDPSLESNLASRWRTVVRRRCIDALRRSYLSRRVLGQGGPASEWQPKVSELPDEQVERLEVRSVLVRIRDHLSPRCQEVLDQLLLGFRLAEVAHALGVTAGAVRNRWFHCRRQIREALRLACVQSKDLVP